MLDTRRSKFTRVKLLPQLTSCFTNFLKVKGLKLDLSRFAQCCDDNDPPPLFYKNYMCVLIGLTIETELTLANRD